jgi:hypothetical protein
MPKFRVEPVDSMTYWSPSAIGAMKVSEATGAGSNGSAPMKPVTNQPPVTSRPMMTPAPIKSFEARNRA